jgi:DNA polymerase-1
MIRIDRKLREQKLQTRMTLQVHDELLFDVPQNEIDDVRTLVKHEMENVIDLNVPIVADVGVGQNWRDLEG